MINRYTLTDEVKKEFTPIVENFINKVENSDPEGDLLSMDLSNTKINPYTLTKVLESLGYKETDQDSNGWQFDFWITMEKKGFKNLQVKGTGITFELLLKEKD
ncbi:hypothetical protein D3C87_78800 [compost metagenome]